MGDVAPRITTTATADIHPDTLAGDFLILVMQHNYVAPVGPPTPSAVNGQAWTLGGTEAVDIGDRTFRWAWWYQRANADLPSDTTSLVDDVTWAQVVTVRDASLTEDLSVYDFNIDAATHTADTEFFPQGTQGSAVGMMIGWINLIAVTANPGNTPVPPDYPNLHESVADSGNLDEFRTWWSDVLTDGPVASTVAPVTFTSDGVNYRAQWLTLWVAGTTPAPPTEDSTGCAVFTADTAVLEGDTAYPVTAVAGYCSPDGYAVISGGTGNSASWTFTLDADTASAFNTAGGVWLRAMINRGVGGTIDADFVTLAVNGVATDMADLLAEDVAWSAANVFVPGGTFIVGLNEVVLEVVNGAGEIATLRVDAIAMGSDGDGIGGLGFDGITNCPSCGSSGIDHYVTILDIPTSNNGTISGRPNLLCATYGVMIIDRRNRATVVRMPESGWDLKFNYRSRRTSEAELTVYLGQGPGDRSGVGAECCADLSRVGEWMHELVIWREGNPLEVWGGPVTSVSDRPGAGTWTCKAHDRSIWWDERALSYDLIYTGERKADAAKVFTELLRAAEYPRSHNGVATSGGQKLPYDPIGLETFAYPTGVMIDQKVLLQADDVIIGTELRSLGDSVLDWCVVGRRVYAGALVLNLDPIPILTQDHWLEQDPTIERNGIGVAQKVVCRGAGDIRGEYPPGQVVTPRWPQYGSHFKLIRDSTITDVEVATERARQYWEKWQQPNFTVLSNEGTLGPKAPVTVEDLIPGRAVQIAILSGCMPTSLRLAENRMAAGLQYYAYDSGQLSPLIVPQRLFETTVEVSDSVESSVKIDTEALGTEVLTRGRRSWPQVGEVE